MGINFTGCVLSCTDASSKQASHNWTVCNDTTLLFAPLENSEILLCCTEIRLEVTRHLNNSNLWHRKHIITGLIPVPSTGRTRSKQGGQKKFPKQICLCFPGLREKDTNSLLLRGWGANKGWKQQQLPLVLPTGPGSHFPKQQELLCVGTATGAAAHTGKEAETNLGRAHSLPAREGKESNSIPGTCANSKPLWCVCKKPL